MEYEYEDETLTEAELKEKWQESNKEKEANNEAHDILPFSFFKAECLKKT